VVVEDLYKAPVSALVNAKPKPPDDPGNGLLKVKLLALNAPPTLNCFATYTPPLTINAPVVEEVESVVLVKVVTPLTDKVLLKVVAPVTDKVPPKVVLPPTFKAPPIPTPPVTTNAPVVVAVESVVSWMLTKLVLLKTVPVLLNTIFLVVLSDKVIETPFTLTFE